MQVVIQKRLEEKNNTCDETFHLVDFVISPGILKNIIFIIYFDNGGGGGLKLTIVAFKGRGTVWVVLRDSPQCKDDRFITKP